MNPFTNRPQEHGASCLVADCLTTPLRAGIFDAVLSIAVLHHLSTPARRVQALREAARLLRVGGQLLVYCWSYEQDDERSRSRHRFVAQDWVKELEMALLGNWERSYRCPGALEFPNAWAEEGAWGLDPPRQRLDTLQVLSQLRL
eukprot:Skav205536  [mRNA]  locus=scaffold1012:36046:41635:- [translate_table: standard]